MSKRANKTKTSLRWYDPDQVQRVKSQFFAITKNTPSQKPICKKRSYYELSL